MAMDHQGGGDDKDRPRRGRGKKKPYHRRKICRFCADHITSVYYKDVKTLRNYVT